MTRTYGRLERDGDQWVISALEPHVAIRLKDNFRQIPRHSVGPFKLPATGLIAADLDWFMGRYPLQAEAATLAAVGAGRRGYEAVQAEAGRLLAPDYQPPLYAGLKPGQSVRPHQGRAAELLARFGGLLVADDVGKGKTYTGAAACLLPGALPATIVVPPHLKSQWRDKLTELTTLTVHVVEGSRPHLLPPVDVRIIGYRQLAGWVDAISTLGTGLVIFEEVHHLRHGPDTAQGGAAKKLAAAARMRLGLSATPIFNMGDEIWEIMRYLRPEVLGDRADFLREYCAGTLTVRDTAALRAFLRDQFAFIREEGGTPPPNRLVVNIDHDAEAIDSVRDAARYLAGRAMTGAPLERGQAVREFDMLLRQATGIAKAPFVAAYTRMLVEAGRPVVLFGYHRAVWDIWRAALGDLGMVLYTGSETPRQKAAALAEFKAGRARVFGMSIRAGEGVDGLQYVSRDAVIGELDWSPAVMAQNIGRVDREGQPCWPEPVNAHVLISAGGTDPFMVDLLGIKSSQATIISGPHAQRSTRDAKPLEALIALYANGEGRAAA